MGNVIVYAWTGFKPRVLESGVFYNQINSIFHAPVLKMISSIDYLPVWVKKPKFFFVYVLARSQTWGDGSVMTILNFPLSRMELNVNPGLHRRLFLRLIVIVKVIDKKI